MYAETLSFSNSTGDYKAVQIRFVTYNTAVKPQKESGIAVISFLEENTRNKVIASLKTH